MLEGGERDRRRGSKQLYKYTFKLTHAHTHSHTPRSNEQTHKVGLRVVVLRNENLVLKLLVRRSGMQRREMVNE